MPAIILVLIVIGTAGYLTYRNFTAPKGTILGPYLPPTPEPIINWKTYNSEKFQFSFEYPDNWTAVCKDPQTDFWVMSAICDIRAPNTTLDNDGKLSSGAYVAIAVEKINSKYKSLEDKVAFDTKNYNYKIKPYILNNVSGYLYTLSKTQEFVFKNGFYFIHINWSPLDDTNQYKPSIDRILSTLKIVPLNISK